MWFNKCPFVPHIFDIVRLVVDLFGTLYLSSTLCSLVWLLNLLYLSSNCHTMFCKILQIETLQEISTQHLIRKDYQKNDWPYLKCFHFIFFSISYAWRFKLETESNLSRVLLNFFKTSWISSGKLNKDRLKLLLASNLKTLILNIIFSSSSKASWESLPNEQVIMFKINLIK